MLTFTRGGELIGMQSGGRAFLGCSLRALYKEMKIKDGRMIGEECDSQCGSLSNDRLKRWRLPIAVIAERLSRLAV